MSGIDECIREIVVSAYKERGRSLPDNFDDGTTIEFSSLEFLSLIIKLEQEFSISIDPELIDWESFVNIRAIRMLIGKVLVVEY